MTRAIIVGSGTEITGNRVTTDMMAKIMDRSDAWIRARRGVATRYFVEPGTATSDLGVAAARKALDHAQVKPEEIDLVVFATMTPDHYFPGCGGILQAKMGLRPVPSFGIRQQCSGFLYRLQPRGRPVAAGRANTPPPG